MKELSQDLFGVLVICMEITVHVCENNIDNKLITVARIRCQRKNADVEFQKFTAHNSGKGFRAEFRFNSAYIG